jgi:hypothetical protein
MANVQYKRSSPYYKTGVYGNFLEVLTPRTITADPDDIVYQIDQIYNLRPDLLAYDLYKDASLWWVFTVRNPNTIEHPVFDFVTGTIIYIPKFENIRADLGL